jgi:hypothetical protein
MGMPLAHGDLICPKRHILRSIQGFQLKHPSLIGDGSDFRESRRNLPMLHIFLCSFLDYNAFNHFRFKNRAQGSAIALVSPSIEAVGIIVVDFVPARLSMFS